MRAPIPRRDTNDIVAAIVEECGDPSIEGHVRALIDGLRTETPPLFGNRKVNEEFADKLRRRINRVEAALKVVPEGFPLLVLFAPEAFLPFYLLGQFPAGQGATAEIAEGLIDTAMEQTQKRLERLQQDLATLRARCDQVIALGLGEHGSAGYPQERAALCSREIMDRCGLPLTCSPTSKYCKVASLFFEAMTGEENRDMRRPCESMACSPFCTEKSSNL